MSARGITRRAVLWFRNDLRLRDNQIFHYTEVRDATELLAVYCLDPRHFEKSSWGDHGRLGPHRARFLAESLEELAQSLQSIGCTLTVVDSKPEDCLPNLLRDGDVLAFQGEDTSEEQDVENEVRRRLRDSVTVLTHYGHTLYHRDDLGFNLKDTLPIPFGKFKFGICDNVKVRKELPAPVSGDLPPSPTDDICEQFRCVVKTASAIQEIMKCGSVAALKDPQQAPSIIWKGGEKAGMARLEEYIKPSGLGTYHRTRNQIQGASNGSRLSPWMANGCLSPRTIYWAAQQFDASQKQKKDGFDHVYKFVFELNWRDYFRFYCAHFGKRVFLLGGPAKRKHDWRRDPAIESRWRDGCTGVPIVDGLMRELAGTGYIANRGRYIVACYLVHYLGIDWRVGADWFERHLLDHDVCSNYGEWASMANVAAAPTRGQPLGLKGRGPTKGSSTGSRGSAGDPWKQGADIGFAMFNPWEQARQYDKTESYVRCWLPELRLVRDGCAHEPHMLSDSERRQAGCSDYPAPLALEPFQYNDVDDHMQVGKPKHRRVHEDLTNVVESRSKRQNAKGLSSGRWRQEKENTRGSTYSDGAWQREWASSSYYPKSTGRRWQAKTQATRVVYMES